MRLIQVGVGNWGRDWHTTVLARNPDVEVVGLVDADGQTLTSAADAIGFPGDRCFDSLEEALTKVPADAVLVTANLDGHVSACRSALEAGKHVLCEKPFARHLDDARQLSELAANHGRIVMVSQNYRHFPAMRWLASAVRDRMFGDLASIAIDFRQYANGDENRNTRYLESWHPLLVDMAIHHLDLLRYIVGSEPETLFCAAQNPRWSRFRDPPSAAATIRFPGGIVASYRGSWISHGPATPWAGRWRVEFEHAHVDLSSRGTNDGSRDEAVVYRGGAARGKPVRLERRGHPTDRAGTLAAFVQAVSTGRPPETSADDNINTLRLMHAMVESAERGTIVRLGDADGRRREHADSSTGME